MSLTRFPDKCRFAFTIIDDTDLSTVANTKPVYDFLADLGFRTTKTVWALRHDPNARWTGQSLSDREYREFARELIDQGFEIALHNVRNSDATRSEVERGFEIFADAVGVYPRTHANHATNRDNVYWGAERLCTKPLQLSIRVATALAKRPRSEGHIPQSPYFWGDVCERHIDYVRNLVFREVNLDRINPTMPYHLGTKPLVRYWFSSCEGGDPRSFCQTLSEANQDSLESEGGVCIMYSHLANGFCSDGKIHSRFATLMRRLAGKAGWFVPVATLLDRLKQSLITTAIPHSELAAMERLWFAQKLPFGTS